ncbi:hypothetical protein RhiirC2_721218 [Rhizophagus irregularis]|uniref:Uncharacterized protein n=1 Tax=Rhizophagus irregularis TaxID=588596 RepID=A0A2N1M745_9GLOM|nr:hypothetical protein RhiirC2_721218 [Rhizophagus irregularis]
MNLEKYYPIFLHQPQVAAKRIHKLFHYLLSHNYEDCIPLNLSAKIDAQNANFTNDISTFIDSALSRTRWRIVLNHIFVDHPTHPTLLTFPDATIDQEVIDHFQNFIPITSTPPSSIQDLPKQWSNAYAPLANVSLVIFDSLMDPPTLDEWSSTLSSMSNDKAPGPSMISYEILKHLEPTASSQGR